MQMYHYFLLEYYGNIRDTLKLNILDDTDNPGLQTNI